MTPTKSFRRSGTSKPSTASSKQTRLFTTGTTSTTKCWPPRFGKTSRCGTSASPPAYHSYEMCQQGVSYAKCQQQRQTEIRGARQDGFVMRDNGMVTGRIQQAFMRIRSGISRYNLHYDWFKVRNANGNGSF